MHFLLFRRLGGLRNVEGPSLARLLHRLADDERTGRRTHHVLRKSENATRGRDEEDPDLSSPTRGQWPIEMRWAEHGWSIQTKAVEKRAFGLQPFHEGTERCRV